MKLVPIRLVAWMNGHIARGVSRCVSLLSVALLLMGCGLPLPLPTQLPIEIPGMPANWDDIQGLMGDLGLPDLSTLGNVPGLEALSGLQTPVGAIAFQGPVEMALATGQRIPGTDILFVGAAAGDDAAQFEINGLRAPRRLGDSLDFDGSWPGMSGVSYHLRLRVYHLGAGQVRAAGVQRLVIENVHPQAAAVGATPGSHVMRFPHSVTTAPGALFPGMTLGYSGQDERGAILTGLAEGEYPYRKIGDSVEWTGRLTPHLAVEYHLRLLYYQEANATLGGVVDVSLPGP
ncbi:MAG: hypothetical protein IT328_26545 [Caldilineaceae bacterium]|nr:hypothetical protein [Caldilineaceae bacterium]